MGRRNIRSNYNSKARDTSRSYHLKNTRERDQTHSYWYIPSAPRENYSLLIMESTGWPLERDSPLWQGAGTGLDWLSVAMEASGGGTPDLLCSSMFLGYMDIYIGERSTSVDLQVVHETGGVPRGVGAPPTLVGPSWLP